MTYYLDLGDGGPLIPCRDAHQAEMLAGEWKALSSPNPGYTAVDTSNTLSLPHPG